MIENEIIKKIDTIKVSILEVLNTIIDKVFDELKPTSSKDIGMIMKSISPLVKGKADMSLVNKLIRERLG